MRKSLIIIVLLLCMSVGVFYYANASVSQGKEAITIDEKVLLGDRSIADGITMNYSTYCNYHLFWNTSYVIGEEPDIKTDFTFSQSRKTWNSINDAMMDFSIITDYSMSSSGAINFEDNESQMPMKPAADVASRASAGSVYTEKVNLNDYYEYYPIQINIYNQEFYNYSDDALLKAVNEFFKIPVKEDHIQEVTITKDTQGNVVSIETSSFFGGINLSTNAVVTENGCYLVFSNYTWEGTEIDTSLIPGGYGVYYLPLKKADSDTSEGTSDKDTTVIDETITDETVTQDSVTPVDPTAMPQMVFPLDEKSTQAQSLKLNLDKTQLYLFTRNNTSILMTVLDLATMTEVQTVDLTQLAADQSIWNVLLYDDFLVVTFSDYTFTLVEINPDNTYVKRFSGDFHECEELAETLTSALTMDYNGTQLAVATNMDYYSNASSYLAVFDQTGLLYAGRYYVSSDRDPELNSIMKCRPADHDPLSVQWNSTN